MSKEFIDRLNDSNYANLIANTIDAFNADLNGMTISRVINKQFYGDLVEVFVRYFAEAHSNDPYNIAVSMFLLGVWLSEKGEVKLPHQIQ